MKKMLLIVLLLILLIVVSSITVFAINLNELTVNLSEISNASEKEVKSAATENEQFLSEKEEFAQEAWKNPSLYAIKSTSQDIVKDIELEKRYQSEKAENEYIEEILVTVLNRFYPKEFNEIRKILEQETIERQNDSNIKKAEYDLCNLVLIIMESNNISVEESNALKKFIGTEYKNVYENLELRTKIEKVIEIE